MPLYGLATIYEDYHVGQEFTLDNLPLHLTHIDSFETEHGADAMGIYVDNFEGEKVYDLEKKRLFYHQLIKRMANIITIKRYVFNKVGWLNGS